MPARSDKEAHLARMAMAIKHGHTLEGVSQAGIAKARQMAEMPEAKLAEFMHTKKSRTMMDK